MPAMKLEYFLLDFKDFDCKFVEQYRMIKIFFALRIKITMKKCSKRHVDLVLNNLLECGVEILIF